MEREIERGRKREKERERERERKENRRRERRGKVSQGYKKSIRRTNVKNFKKGVKND